MADVDCTRPCGTLERWYLARSHAGSPPPVHVGFSIELNPPIHLSPIREQLHSALDCLVHRHTYLNARIFDHTSSAPKIGFSDGPAAPARHLLVESYGMPLRRALEVEVSRQIDVSGPLWRALLVVSQEVETSSPLIQVYVGVTIHHLLADGLSALAVAKSLVVLLNNNLTLSPANLSTLSYSLPLPLEVAVPLRLSLGLVISTIYDKVIQPRLSRFLPMLSTTTFRGIPDPIPHPRQQRIHLIPLPYSLVATLVSLCRTHKMTLTSLIHTLLVASISPLLIAKQHIASAIPMSLLPLFPSSREYSVDRGGCYAAPAFFTSGRTDFPSSLAEFVRLSAPCAAKLHSPDVRARAAQIWSVVSYTPSMEAVHRSNLQSTNDLKTFSLSNLGLVVFTPEDVNGGWIPKVPVFTQPINGSGAAVVAGLVTVSVGKEAGDGMLAMTWEEGLIAGHDIDGVVLRVEEGLKQLISWGSASEVVKSTL